jgi:hypothetical protein
MESDMSELRFQNGNPRPLYTRLFSLGNTFPVYACAD